MKKHHITTLLLLALFAGPALALDLTPHEVVAAGYDGPSMLRYFFEHEGKRLTFRLDSRMTVSGGSTAATFRFRDMETAGMKLAKSPLPRALPFDEKNVELYRASARSFLPSSATDIRVGAEVPNPITINGWTSQQYNFTYNLFGVAHRRAVTFLNFSAQEQLVFDVSGAAADYDKVYARGYRVLNSLGDIPVAGVSGPT